MAAKLGRLLVMAQNKHKQVKAEEWVDISPDEEWEDIEPEKSKFNQFIDYASTPLIDAPSRYARDLNEKIGYAPDSMPAAYKALHEFGRGALEGIGDVASGFTAPANIIPMLLGAGNLGAEAEGLSSLANLMRRGTQAASAIPVIHGGQTILDPSKDLSDKAFGLAEVAGGAAGMHFPEASPRLSKSKPSAFKPAEGEIVKAAGKDQVVTGYDDKGKPKLRLIEEQAKPENDPNFNAGEGDPELAGSIPYQQIEEPNIVDQIFPDMKKIAYERPKPQRYSQSSRFHPAEDNTIPPKNALANFMNDEKGEINFDALFGERTPHPDEFDIGDLSPESINLDQAALEAGSDTARPIGRGSTFNKQRLLEAPIEEVPPRLNEFSEDVSGYDMGQPEIPERTDLPDMPHEFQPDMEMPPADIADIDLPVKYAFDWPEFHKDGSTERMFNVEAGPEQNSTLSEGTLRNRGVKIPEALQNFMADESGELDFSGFFNRDDRGSLGEGLTASRLAQDELAQGLPVQKMTREPSPEQSLFGKVMDFPKGAMSVDLPFMTSAAFRQAKPLAWTGEWFKAWGQAAKAYGSEVAAKQIDDDIMNSKYFKPRFKKRYDAQGNIKGYKEVPSIAEEIGVKLTKENFTGREEVNRSQLAEKLPGPWGDLIKRSNRAYGAFLNHLRKTKFEELMEQTKWSGNENNADIAESLAEFVNDATGRGSLKWEGPGGRKANLERYAPALQNALWSPRLIASNTKFLNPYTYINLPPEARNQYIAGTLRMAATWIGFAGLAQMAGADVNLDPTNSDFGKIKVGDMRIDPAGGLQQLIVFAARELPKAIGEMTRTKTGAFTSSTTGKTKEFGKGAFPIDRASVAEDFTTSKLNPMWKLAYDLMRASDKRPVHLGDRAVQMAMPMMAQDIMDTMKKDPDLAKMLGMGLSSSVGMGTAFYGKGDKFNDPTFTNEIESFLGLDPRSLAGTVK